ncbi:MAG: sensor histidine kinase [Flavobacteriales bacterium]|nr:sensor histidine kinase [Flavobacteriales bacterium]
MLLPLGASFLIFINKRNTHKLEEKNAQIQLALEEKQLMLREIHHRVKNNLQVVSSLLGIQSRHIDDKVAHEAITASRSRVLSMSLIHQNLYTQDSLTNIHIRNYVSDLCSSIMSTYSRSSQITLHTEVDETQIDVDTLIPLGLITNELINNALKHAFEEEQTGNLWVKLVETQGGLVLEIKDDGVGFNVEDHQGKGSFGMKMLDAFAKKLRAKWTIKGDNGTTFTMWVDKNKVA